MNLKEVKDLWNENNKILLKEVEEDTDKCKYIPCLWIEKINIVNMLLLTKAMRRFMQFLSKSQWFPPSFIEIYSTYSTVKD